MTTQSKTRLTGQVRGSTQEITEIPSFDSYDASFRDASYITVNLAHNTLSIMHDPNTDRIIIKRETARGEIVRDGAIGSIEVDAKTGAIMVEKSVEPDGTVSAITRNAQGKITGDTRGPWQRVKALFHPKV